MKSMDFKRFKMSVESADVNDSIWYMGFLWLQLTRKQCNKIVDVLKNNNNCRLFIEDGYEKIRVPSGLVITKKEGE